MQYLSAMSGVQQKVLFTVLALAVPCLYRRLSRSNFYLRDFAVYRAPISYQTTGTEMLRIARNFHFSADAASFVRRLHSKTGLGPRVAVPPHLRAQQHSIEDARKEASDVMFATIDELLLKTRIVPSEIGVVVTNCSLFNPTPSLASMLIKKYQFPPTTHAYSLGGMGCGAGPVAVDLVRAMMKFYGCKYGLLLSTENMTQHFYNGEDRSMLLPNTLFRMGGAAMLFTSERKGSKYALQNLIKTHNGRDKSSYESVYQTIDNAGKTGVRLDRSITKCAQNALKNNLHRLLPRCLPKYELFRFLASNLYRKITKQQPEVMPKICSGIDKFCFHCGGRGVLDGMQQMFNLNKQQMEASRAALWRYGNTSSASIWYGLAYHENQGVKRGDNIWQIAFGSGFKANSLVWRSLGSKNITKFCDEEWKWDEQEGYDLIDQEVLDIDYHKEDEEKKVQDEENEFQQFLQKYWGRIEILRGCNIRDVKQEICMVHE
ncbi:3-ketoacyl-CoA synthase [Spironucleus salmonicida]|uniref:3-ketoacyl-CoA synthase n=1 Tax=Spironucleus salmonicida TaxID=348837 RepID=V6LBG3_9EUKA|nr:3-ketoacyl-CoA synthase [Spironucleus salmonicida]|eukprot:EST41795.1 3-ketoacyl-CoA synthase [Spironucleus salmonicida]